LHAEVWAFPPPWHESTARCRVCGVIFQYSLTQWHGWMACTHIFCCFWLGSLQKMTNAQGQDVAGGFEYARIFLPNRCNDSTWITKRYPLVN
jgi:hypothetical protein